MPRSPPSSSLARLAMTSFTFMFVWVPLPVCQTTRGNSASCLPAITSSAAAMIALADRGVLELAQVEVHLGRRPLHQGQRVDQLDRHPVFADLEVLERALGLRSPEPVGRNLHFAHRVGFDAELACHGTLHLDLTTRKSWISRTDTACHAGCIGATLDGSGCHRVIFRCRTGERCDRGRRR